MQSAFLNAESCNRLEFTTSEIRLGRYNFELCCLLYVHSSREVPSTALLAAMARAWSFHLPELEQVSSNKYNAFFLAEDYIQYVMKNRPWHFHNYLPMFVLWHSGGGLSDEDFQIANYWIQIHGILEEAYTL